MKPDGKLMKWLASAKKGRCPCGKKVAPRRRVCSPRTSACRRKYETLLQEDRRGPTALRAVVEVLPHKDNPRHQRVVLVCGHEVVLVESIARRVGRRRRCPTCADSGGTKAKR